MSTPDFSKPSGSGAPDPFGPPPGAPAQPGSGDHGQPAYGQPAYGQPAFGQPAFGQPDGYGQPAFGQPAPYGSAGGFGTPAPYGSAGGVVGPGGEWLGPPLASWGRRVGGYLIDTVLVAAVTFALTVVDDGLGNIANLVLFLVLGYLTGTTGQTPGRRAVGIKVLRLRDGQVLGAGAGIGRQFLHILDALPLLLGYLWPLWDKKNQTFADKLIGSVVIKL